MSQPESTDQRAALDNCTGHVTCASSLHVSGCPSDQPAANVPAVDPARVAVYAEAIRPAKIGRYLSESTMDEFWPVVTRAVIAVADTELAELRAEVEQLRRGGRELGRIVVRHGEMVLQATGLHDWIDEDGDGDWAAVWENLATLRPRAETAEAESASRGEQICALVDDRAVWRERALLAEARVRAVEVVVAEFRPMAAKNADVRLGADAVLDALDAALVEASPDGAVEAINLPAGSIGSDDEVEEPCPDCGDDPADPTLHVEGCRRIGTDVQCGPPWKPWPTDAPVVEGGE